MIEDRSADNGVESDYSRQTAWRRGMRTGYTTGSCAAAAAKAATVALLTGVAIHEVSIHLPVGRDASFPVHRCQYAPDGKSVLCSVIKDGGDDPDVTHGAEIFATVSRSAASGGRVIITGGPGVGTVTRPGTGIPVGDPAVTRVPRRMIGESVEEAASGCGAGPEECFEARISVTNGEEIALKTTNARLGVMGGVSILGSTGVVQPYSTAAWRASVHLAIDVAAANNLSHLVLSTGTQSEAFSRLYLDLPDMAYVEAGIFSGPALKRCVMRKVERATHVGMVGKFSKMAMGYFVTHVAGNKVDVNFLASLAGRCGASAEVQARMREASSGRHFQEIAQAADLNAVFPLMCQLVCEESHKQLGQDAGALIVDALCFDFDGTLLGYASTSPQGMPMLSLPIRHPMAEPAGPGPCTGGERDRAAPGPGAAGLRLRAAGAASRPDHQARGEGGNPVLSGAAAGQRGMGHRGRHRLCVGGSGVHCPPGTRLRGRAGRAQPGPASPQRGTLDPPNVQVAAGEAPEALESLPAPDSVFVGGSGGKLAEILDAAARRLNPGGRIVVNLAALERTQEARRRLAALGLTTELSQVVAARGKEMPDGATRLKALNPVFVLTAGRGD